MKTTILLGDNIDLLKAYPDNFFSSIVTDCPYGLGKEPDANKVLQDWIDHGYHEIKGGGFMGKHWDRFVPQPRLWKEVLRVLKPGGHLLAFFGTRTYDWGTLAIRLAGFEIRDMITWHYAEGFPKSLNIKKQLTKMGSDQAETWDGWGSALKPATEPICLARKPLEGSISDTVLAYGVGGLNINDCRIGFKGDADLKAATYGTGTNIMGGNFVGSKLVSGRKNIEADKRGRWPANVIFDTAMAGALDEQSGELTSGNMDVIKKGNNNNVFGQYNPVRTTGYGDTGGASRFFYCAKATQDERNAGCESLAVRAAGYISNTSGKHITRKDEDYQPDPIPNFHPTIKPISIMRYLLRMITPKGGITLDMYAGSGTTGCAAHFEDIGEIVLMEMDEDYIPIIEARTKYWSIEYNRRKYLEDLKDPEKQPENQLKMF